MDFTEIETIALPGHGDCAPFGWIRANNRKLKALVEEPVADEAAR